MIEPSVLVRSRWLLLFRLLLQQVDLPLFPVLALVLQTLCSILKQKCFRVVWKQLENPALLRELLNHREHCRVVEAQLLRCLLLGAAVDHVLVDDIDFQIRQCILQPPHVSLLHNSRVI